MISCFITKKKMYFIPDGNFKGGNESLAVSRTCNFHGKDYLLILMYLTKRLLLAVTSDLHHKSTVVFNFSFVTKLAIP